MPLAMQSLMAALVYAERAWLGSGHFARRVVVEFNSQITAVRELREQEPAPPDATQVDLLMPAFVNAHCHLEYSWLAGELSRGKIPFGEWMRAIMARRPQSADDFAKREEAMDAAAKALLASGCTMVFDSTTDGSSAAALDRVGIRHFLFHEILGLTEQRARPMLDAALEKLKDERTGAALGAGLNPHALYSVGPWLREQLKAGPAAALPQAWHLAETPDEEQLFRAEAGSIADFLRDFRLPLPEASAPGSFQFLQQEGLLEKCDLVFHGNELSADDAAFFAAPRGMVHCPGTHRWFHRPPVPLAEWLRAGVNVCLGTDSLASSDSLSMVDMVRVALEDNPDLSADDVLTMACANPWKLGLLGATGLRGGAIESGAVADLVGINAREAAGGTEWRDVLTGNAPDLCVWQSGRRVASDG
jgi:cytosine/adenosine deaminase-related metal-dependent hydrolase